MEVKTLSRLALLACAALALTACASGEQPPAPEDQPAVTTVQGDIENWTGAGTVTLSGPSGQALARAAVAADGTFSLTLPDEAALAGAGVTRSPADALAQLGCTNTVTSSDPAARGYGFLSLDARPDGGDVGPIFAVDLDVTTLFGVPVSAEAKGRAWLYADRDTTLSGHVTCKIAEVNAAVQVNIAAKQGWNVLAMNVGGSVANPGGVTGTLTTAADTQTTWRTQADLLSKLPAR